MESSHQSSKKQFSVTARANSLKHALRGIRLFFKTQHNAWIQLAIAIVALFAGFFFSITKAEWIAVIFAIIIVFIAEAFNTAIEIDINLTSPEYHPYAKDTKDVAAGAVLLAVAGAGIIGIVVFLPYIKDFLLPK